MLFAVPGFMKKDEDILVSKTEKEEQEDLILYHKQKEAFLDQLNEVLATGNPVLSSMPVTNTTRPSRR